ncbi:MAG TPA: hypothetical protein VIK91_07690 [Nannocystis sp.]
MTLAGEGRRPTWEHMRRLAQQASIDLKVAPVHRWPAEARQVGVERATIRELKKRLDAVERDASCPSRAPDPSADALSITDNFSPITPQFQP